MGGGASRRRKQDATKAIKSAALQALAPAIIRRRKVLLGSANLRPFEQVDPKNQFTQLPEHSPGLPACISCGSPFMEDTYTVCQKCGEKRPAPGDDLVFKRLDFRMANDFRQNAWAVCNQDFMLGAHAIAKLGLGLEPPFFEKDREDQRSIGTLERRLFQIGQVGKYVIPPATPEKGKKPETQANIIARTNTLTCYELLALFSVIRAGAKDELLELLFCLFDVDEDDEISCQDFETTISSFLEVDGLLAGLDNTDAAAYRKVGPKDKAAAARRAAELAVSKYGAGVELSPPEPDKAAADKKKVKKTKAAPAAKPNAKAKARSKSGDRRWCLCGGKQPDEKDSKGKKDEKREPLLSDDDSDGSKYSSELPHGEKEKENEKEEKEATAKKRRGFWSPRRGKAEDKKDGKDKDKGKEKDASKGKSKDKGKDELSDGEEDDSGIKTSKELEGGPKQLEEAEQQDSASAPKASAKKKSKAGCCPICRGSKGKKNSMPALSFEQFKQWFTDNFGDFELPDPSPAPAPVFRHGHTTGELGSAPFTGAPGASGVTASGMQVFRAPGDDEGWSNPSSDNPIVQQPLLA